MHSPFHIPAMWREKKAQKHTNCVQMTTEEMQLQETHSPPTLPWAHSGFCCVRTRIKAWACIEAPTYQPLQQSLEVFVIRFASVPFDVWLKPALNRKAPVAHGPKPNRATWGSKTGWVLGCRLSGHVSGLWVGDAGDTPGRPEVCYDTTTMTQWFLAKCALWGRAKQDHLRAAKIQSVVVMSILGFPHRLCKFTWMYLQISRDSSSSACFAAELPQILYGLLTAR